MVIENHPSLFDLSAAEKLLLSEELCTDALLSAEADPELAKMVRERLDEFRNQPDTGISWEALKAKLLGSSAS